MSIFFRFKPIATALSPNTETDDILLTLKLFLPWNWSKWQKGKVIEQLENEFKKYFGVKYAIGFSSGRVGLYVILKNLPNTKYQILNTEVITQAYTTIAVPNAIKWAGFKPVYVDIKEETYNIDPEKIEAKITPKTKAIIVQHTFGVPAEMDKICVIAKKYNLFLIEDCAHSLGAEYKEKKVGTFGDAAFFSFGRDKVISGVSGGMVITNSQEIAKKIKEFRDTLLFPSRKFIFTQLLHPIAFVIILPTYYFFNFGQGLLWLLQKLRLLTRAYTKEEKNGIMPKNFMMRLANAVAILVLAQFRKLEKFNAHRQKIAKIYQDYFTQKQYGNMNYHTKLKTDEFYEDSSQYGNMYYHTEIRMPKIPSETKPVFLYYTIQIKNSDQFLKYAKKNHTILGDWFPGALGPKGVEMEKFGYKKGDCLISEKVGEQTLNLPTHIKTSESDAKEIINLIKDFLDKNLLLRWKEINLTKFNR